MANVINITKGIPGEYSVGTKVNKAKIRTTDGKLEYLNAEDVWRPLSQLIQIDDIVAAQASEGSIGTMVYVTETMTIYEYLENGSGYAVNGLSVLSTGLGGNTRYIGIAGQHVVFGSASDTQNVVRIQVNAMDLVNKYIELPHIPTDVNDVTVFVESGIIGAHQIDYDVSGNRIVWNGLQWDGMLAVGDVLKVIYWHV